MARKTPFSSPQSARLLCHLGERLRLLRVRHRLSAKQMATSAGMSVMTLRSLERGNEGVAIGAYLAVMGVLGVERDLDGMAAAAFAADPEELDRAVREPRPRAPRRGDGIPAVSAKRRKSRTATAAAAADDPPSSGATTDTPSATAAAPMPDWPVAGEPGFEWLDAPAKDLQRLLRFDTAADAGEAEADQESATLDLFEGRGERRTTT